MFAARLVRAPSARRAAVYLSTRSEGSVAAVYRGKYTDPEVEKRYANALYKSAAARGELAEVSGDLSLLKETLAKSPVLLNFVTDPSIPRQQKEKGITDLLTSAKASETTIAAMAALAGQGRGSQEGGTLDKMVAVIDLYEARMKAASGEVYATITSAEALPAAEMQAISKQIGTFLEEGQKPVVTTKVDPKLISGVVIEIGDRVLDLSTATQLKKLKSLLLDGTA